MAPAASALRGLLLLALCTALLLQAAFCLRFMLDPIDYYMSSIEAADFLDASFVWMHIGAALVGCSLGLLSLVLAVRAADIQWRIERAVAVCAVQLLAMAIGTISLMPPQTPSRTRLARLVQMAQAACSMRADCDLWSLPLSLAEHVNPVPP